MPLDPMTLRMIEDAIRSHPCRVCGGPADRVKSGGHFYCLEHFPVNPRAEKHHWTVPHARDHRPDKSG